MEYQFENMFLSFDFFREFNEDESFVNISLISIVLFTLSVIFPQSRMFAQTFVQNFDQSC